MNIIWYLIIFGVDHSSSQAIPEPSREVCMQQAADYENWLSNRGYSSRAHAYCVAGLPK